MFSKQSILMILPMACLILLFTQLSIGGNYAVPALHPDQEGEDVRFCTDCHEENTPINYRSFDHTRLFVSNHRIEASQSEELCSMCHKPRFCSDCHASSSELKPSIKNQTANARWFQHRGDYISRHKIEGRINPASCVRCHQNRKASQTCVPCHG
ncbi:cytochrome c [Desulfoluna limicola]|uniref:Cytochrome c n=1 Tax=Desulfoluna limicola TaxID=2810562 RepID=A0ABM7PDJ5_9BACT|nr:hypothetical protein [Desulfoluna limicola]BCS95163.1 cytochrome c [Desulfoluna limicola]